MTWLAQLLGRDNLLAAYHRARYFVSYGESLGDQREIAEWEDDLDAKLDEVSELLSGDPGRIPCRLVPVPKPEGKFRAYYSIPLQYHVGWAALIQTWGPALDKRMPAWSYGYRLRRPRVRTKRGNWRWEQHDLASRELYLGFERAWKPFRRYMNLTIQHMLEDSQIEDAQAVAIKREEENLKEHGRAIPRPAQELDFDIRYRRFPYLRDPWRECSSELWYARLDIKRFFPSLPAADIPAHIRAELAGLFTPSDLRRIHRTVKRWCRFEHIGSGIPARQQKHLDPELVTKGGLPVGLVASGFLANVWMLPVDRALDEAIHEEFLGKVAVFRYVDDWVIVASERAVLCRWLDRMWRTLEEAGLSVNLEKLHPALLRPDATSTQRRAFLGALRRGGDPKRLAGLASPALTGWRPVDGAALLAAWTREGSLTLHRRQGFLSTALHRMSVRAFEEVDLLDDDELDARILDLKDLSTTSQEEHNVRADTLHAFAAGQFKRTPLISPRVMAEYVRQGRREDSSGEESTDWEKQALQQINRRGRRMVEDVVASVLEAPHKRRLLERWIQVSAHAIQWQDGARGLDRSIDRIAALLAVGAVDQRPIIGANADSPALLANSLAFLRAILWRSLAGAAGRHAALLATTGDPVDPGWGRWPTSGQRNARALAWLVRCAERILERLQQADARPARKTWSRTLEEHALELWRLWEIWILRPDALLQQVSRERGALTLQFVKEAVIPWVATKTGA